MGTETEGANYKKIAIVLAITLVLVIGIVIGYFIAEGAISLGDDGDGTTDGGFDDVFGEPPDDSEPPPLPP